MVAGPGVKPGTDSRALVETIDVGKTACDLCGIAPHDLDQGRSLGPVLRGETTRHRDTVYAEMGCDRMLRTEHHKLMWGDPALDRRRQGRLHLDKPVTIAPSPRRLFDLKEDPNEQSDLAGAGAHACLESDMLARLLARVNENLQPLPNKSRGEYRPL